MQKFLPLVVTLSLFCITAFAETFRVHKTVTIQLDSSGERVTAFAGVNDAIAFTLPQDLTFVEGVDILFKVPQEVAYWQDSVAWSIYNGLKQKPTAKTIDYRGDRIKVGTFGSSLSLNLKVPLTEKNTIKKDAYSYFVEEIPDFKNNILFMRLQLAMKGTSDSLTNSLFEVSAKPIFINKGKLVLSTSYPENLANKPYTVFIDGEVAELKENGLFLAPGQHSISIVSDYYRNELRTITIEQAKVMQLAIELRDIAPTVRVAAPEHTKVYCDDKELKNNGSAFTIATGNHVFKFVIGDYEIIKTINAVKGKSYIVAVNIDAEITEEE